MDFGYSEYLYWYLDLMSRVYKTRTFSFYIYFRERESTCALMGGGSMGRGREADSTVSMELDGGGGVDLMTLRL